MNIIDKIIARAESFFKRLYQSPFYRQWGIYTITVFFVGLFLVVNVDNRVIYAMNLTSIFTYLAFVLLVAFSLVYITLVGIESIVRSSLKEFVLFAIPSLFLVLGLLSPRVLNQTTFSNKLVTTQLNQTENANRISSATHLTDLYQEVESGKVTFADKANVYIFYKRGCSLCKIGLPPLLKTLTTEEKNNIMFINLDDVGGSAIAKKMGVRKASTAVVYSDKRASYYQLAIFDEDKGELQVLNGNHHLIKEAAAR